MKRFLIRCAIAGAMIGGAAAASFSAVSSTATPVVPISSNSVAPPAAAPAAAAPAAPAANTGAASTSVGAAGVPSDPAGTAMGCVGSAVSFSAHYTQQTASEGFGDVFKDANVGVTPGDAIKNYATNFCGKH